MRRKECNDITGKCDVDIQGRDIPNNLKGEKDVRI